jgi:hypothetical protein
MIGFGIVYNYLPKEIMVEKRFKLIRISLKNQEKDVIPRGAEPLRYCDSLL